jgi:GNAT superfamily N-acetyltransferase
MTFGLLMFHAKNMITEDIPFAVDLTDKMSWNLAKEDFEFMLKLEPHGCFVLTEDAERVGIVTTVCFGKKGWLGNLIVAEPHRKEGAGRLLVKQAIKYLTSRGAETIGLYAYLDTIPFYKKLGFHFDSEFAVLKRRAFLAQVKALSQTNLKEANKGNKEEIIGFDRTCFNASRKKLLEPILQNPSNPCYIYIENGKMIGYATAKKYEDMAELGPLVCEQKRTDVAIDLLRAILNELPELYVSTYVPMRELKILNMLTMSGFKEDFRVARMFFNPDVVKDCIYLAESLERG